MSETLTYKKRFWLITGALFLLVWVAFRFGFARTVEMKREIDDMSAKINAIQDAPARFQAINQRLQKLDLYMGDFSGEEISPLLMKQAGHFCESHQMVLKMIPEKHIYISSDYSIITNKLVVKGNFKSLLTFLHDLETVTVAGRIHSANFEVVYDNNNDQRELFCTYYIQAVGKTLN